MNRKRDRKEPGFLRQGVLIVLPVVLLAGLGLWSTRQDRLLATQEARERAQTLANELTRRIWTEWTGSADRADPDPRPPASESRCEFTVDAQGRLLQPPPFSPTPVPALWDLSRLSERQRALWQAAQALEYEGAEPQTVAHAWGAFVANPSHPDFAAAGYFAEGLAWARQGSYGLADEAFAQAARRSGALVAESGLPFRTLADLQQLRLRLPPSHEAAPPPVVVRERASRGGAPTPSPASPGTNPPAPVNLARALRGPLDFDAMRTHTLDHPSCLTPQLLAWAQLVEAASVSAPTVSRDWLAVWASHQRARALHRAAEGKGLWRDPAAQAAWLALPELWLLTAKPSGEPTGSERHWLGRTETELRQAVATIVREELPAPSFFGATVEVAGRIVGGAPPSPPLAQTGGRASASPPPPAEAAPPPLATQSRKLGGLAVLTVSLHWADEARWYARQRTRTLWVGAFVAVAAATALYGLAQAHGAYWHQRRLGELKSDFVASVSHELRAPIASVRLMVERLAVGRVRTEEKRAEYFGLILRECQRLSALIENVLDFSRIERDRKVYEKEPVDALELVRQTVEAMGAVAAERQVRLATRLPEATHPLPSPNWDGRAVQQALVNLIDNALKHSADGQTVTVGLEWPPQPPREGLPGLQPAPTPTIHLWVEDQGPGIPASEHGRIFERFYRLGSELRRETPGAGIGLSIVKHIVEAHGGRVTVRSEIGQGSRFTLELPL